MRGPRRLGVPRRAGTPRGNRGNWATMNAQGVARMRAVGSVLRELPRQEHNRLVAALSRRAAPVTQWGPVLSHYPEVVKARVASLQTGDLVLTSTRVGSWVGNTVQVLTGSTWNHVAMVVRGVKTDKEEPDKHPVGWCHLKKAYVPRGPFHFKVHNDGEPHLFEASWQGTHIYDSIMSRLFEDPAYDEYATIGVRALQGIERTPAYMQRLEDWIAKTRGTAFEAEADLHSLFDDVAGGTDTMHCAEQVTETLKAMDLISPRFVSGTAPPCAYADGPFGQMKLRAGSYGPIEILKADDESLDVLEAMSGAGASAGRRQQDVRGVPLSQEAPLSPWEDTRASRRWT